MHEHSDKIQPKKLLITAILAVLLLGYAYITKDDRKDGNKESGARQAPSGVNTTSP